MRILGVDLSAIYRWLWEAKSGKPEQGSETFSSCIDWVTRHREGFDRVAIAVDPLPEKEGEPLPRTFRRALYPKYKSSRPAHHPAYHAQLRRAAERLAADGCHVLYAPTVPFMAGSDGEPLKAEADDSIAALVAWVVANGHECVLAIADKDLLALAGAPNVRLLGATSDKFLEVSQVAERLGVKDPTLRASIGPAQVADMLALMGDKSDDIPGIEGIGPESAAKIIQAYGSAIGLLARFDHPEPFEGLDGRTKGALLKAVEKHAYSGIQRDVMVGCELAPLRADCGADWSFLNEPAQVLPVAPKAAAPPEEPAPPSDRGPAATEAQIQATEQARQAELVQAGEKRNGGTAMTLHQGSKGYELAPYAIQPHSVQGAWDVACKAVDSRASNFAMPEQAYLVIMRGRELGIPAMAALTSAYVVKGKISWSAAAMAGMVKRDPRCEYFEIVESTATHATVASRERNRPEKRLTYTLDEAKQAGLVKPSPDRNGEESCQWIKRPATMLRWAAFREAARAFWPDVVTGIYTPDELRAGHETEAELQ